LFELESATFSTTGMNQETKDEMDTNAPMNHDELNDTNSDEGALKYENPNNMFFQQHNSVSEKKLSGEQSKSTLELCHTNSDEQTLKCDNSNNIRFQQRSSLSGKTLSQEQQKSMSPSVTKENEDIRQCHSDTYARRSHCGTYSRRRYSETYSPPSIIDARNKKEKHTNANKVRSCLTPLRLRLQKSGPNSAKTEASMLHDQDQEKQLLRRRKPVLTDEQLERIPRLVHRNMHLHQSDNKIATINSKGLRSVSLKRILRQDWFHVLLRMPFLTSMMSLLIIWILAVIMFAAIYMSVDDSKNDCGLGQEGETISFGPAFAFSLETCTTVGYGLPNSTNAFFESECSILQAMICLQMIWSMMFNAFLFGFLFARLSRCESRGLQVLFSEKAIIECRDDKWYLHVRVYDLDSQLPVVEAHIRMYCVSWRDYEKQSTDMTQPHLLHHMRILRPNDDLGAMMFTSIPANVTHHIDAYSPLVPPEMRRKVNVMNNGGLELREVDDMTGSRNDICCPVCGETYGTFANLERHIAYLKLLEDADDSIPILGSHRDRSLVKPKHIKPMVLTESDIREHLMDKEIMCVLEGIEPMVSGTFQALQSYKLTDIVFGGRFVPCMFQKDGKIHVDVSKFNKIEPPSEASLHYYKTSIRFSTRGENCFEWSR